MPEFWQFPTVSMGLGPLMAIYQARFLKYLHARGIANTENRKVWVFCGDGEMDEVESLGAIGLAARENLDNLIFVVNCNLQRLMDRSVATARLFKNLKVNSAVLVGTSSSCYGAASGTSSWLATKTVPCARS